MEDIFGSTPLVVRSNYPDEYKTHIDWRLRKGDLVRMLPGVHRRKVVEETFEVRALAVSQWRPDAILLGGAAARLSWWPELRVEKIVAACKNPRQVAPWLEVQRRSIDPELFVEKDGIRVAGVELSILEMSITDHGVSMAEGLRRGVTTVAALREVNDSLPKNVRGNAVRRRVLEDCREQPWSALEIDAHRRLREAHVTGWKANHKVIVDGKTYFLDAAFVAEKIAVEFDSEEFHGPGQRETDLQRQNDLVRAGWTIFRFTDATVDDMVETIAPVLRERRANWKRRPLPPEILAAAPVASHDDPERGDGEWHVA